MAIKLASAAAARPGTIGAGPGFLDRQAAALDVLAVQAADSLLGLVLVFWSFCLIIQRGSIPLTSIIGQQYIWGQWSARTSSKGGEMQGTESFPIISCRNDWRIP